MIQAIFWATFVSVFAELIGLAANVVQLRHVITRKTIRGLSGWGWTLGLGGNIAWTTYGVQKHIPALAVANVVLSAIALIMLGKLYHIRSQRRQMVIYALLVGLSLSVMFVLFRDYSGWLGFVYGTASRLPQLYRASKDKVLNGISFGSQLMWLTQNSLVALYAVLFKAWPLTITASVGVISTLYLVRQVALKGRSS